MNRICSLVARAAQFGATDLSLLSMTLTREIAGLGAALLTIAGVGLCWRAPRKRMSIEERAKDGGLTSAEAERKIRFNQWFGPALTLTGCALLAFALLN